LCGIPVREGQARSPVCLCLLFLIAACRTLCCGAGLREGEPTALFDRSFDNAINIAIVRTKVRTARALLRHMA